MKHTDIYIYVFKKFEIIENFLCFIESKESFINNSFEEINYVIIKSGESPSKRRKLFLKQFIHKYGEPIKKYSLDKFFQIYKKEIIQASEFLKQNNVELSFLEKYQFAYMLHHKKEIPIEEVFSTIQKQVNLILNKY